MMRGCMALYQREAEEALDEQAKLEAKLDVALSSAAPLEEQLERALGARRVGWRCCCLQSKSLCPCGSRCGLGVGVGENRRRKIKPPYHTQI